MWIISPDRNIMINSNKVIQILKDRYIENIVPTIDIISVECAVHTIKFDTEIERDEYFNNIIKGLEQEACK